MTECFHSRTLSNRFTISITEADVFKPRKKANIKLVSVKCIILIKSKQICRRCGTRTPYLIAQELGIQIMECPFIKQRGIYKYKAISFKK